MTAASDDALQRAEILLVAGRPVQAAASFDRAEQLGAPPDYCAGRRWTCYMLAGNYEAAWQQK